LDLKKLRYAERISEVVMNIVIFLMTGRAPANSALRLKFYPPETGGNSAAGTMHGPVSPAPGGRLYGLSEMPLWQLSQPVKL